MESPAPFLGEHRFKAMFTNLLGWDHASNALKASAAGRDFSFTSVAHKRGLQVLQASTDNLVLVNRGLLRNVQRLVAKTFHEHILIFSCDNPRKQVWQWAVRLPDGRKLRHREHPFFSHLPPEPFLNRLGNLRFTLDQEENATLIEALDRVRRVLDTSADLNLFVKHPRYAERSAQLFAAAKNGDVQAMQRFLVFHLPLARKISKRLCRWFGILPEDAEQIGFFGLIEAARRFRPEYGCQFSTYATPWVKQVCQRFGPSFALMIHIPDHAFWASFRLRLTLEGLVSKIGSAGVHHFLTELDLHDPKAGRYLRDLVRVTSIKSLSDRKEPEYRAARQIAQPSIAPIDDMKQAEVAARVQTAVSKLRTRDAQIIRLRYGFDGCPAQTLEEIGHLFSLPKERVRQLQGRAEAHLRGLLDGELDDLSLPDPTADQSAASEDGHDTG